LFRSNAEIKCPNMEATGQKYMNYYVQTSKLSLVEITKQPF